jgi:hypothetical protein
VGATTTQHLLLGGRLRFYAHEWEKITSDITILDIVQHCHIDLDTIPIQLSVPFQANFNAFEHNQISLEISKLLSLSVIESSVHEIGEYISTIFPRPKKDGSVRLILNLKSFNANVSYQHFKMENRYMAGQMLERGAYMASIDLLKAYYLVPISPDNKRYLKFLWESRLYCFNVLPYGLACAPRLFTKLLKPVYAKLREDGVHIVSYIDDSFIVARTFNDCLASINKVTALLQRLGFIINCEKSVTVPTTRLEFLGFIFDSNNMTVSLPTDKVDKIVARCKELKLSTVITIQTIAEIIGIMISYCEASDEGLLHYRALERDKTNALKLHNGDFRGAMGVSEHGWEDISWWEANAHSTCKLIWRPAPSIVISSDASLLGWGASCGDKEAGGRWTTDESQNHINVLELMAGLLALRSFASDASGVTIKLQTDNNVAVAYINKKGGKTVLCDSVAKEIWSFCFLRNLWLVATFIPGKENTTADKLSREFHDSTEWAIDQTLFDDIISRFGAPDIDLFASRINAKVTTYAAWRPDPGAAYIDAFTLNWSSFNLCYIFPPFSLLSRCLQKIRQERATGIIIVPMWPTQPWWSSLQDLMTQAPMPIENAAARLHSPTGRPHPLRKLRLLACKVSGKNCGQEGYRHRPLTS